MIYNCLNRTLKDWLHYQPSPSSPWIISLENTWLQKVRMMRLSPLTVGTKKNWMWLRGTKKNWMWLRGERESWHFIWHRYCFLVILHTVSRSGKRGQRCSSWFIIYICPDGVDQQPVVIWKGKVSCQLLPQRSDNHFALSEPRISPALKKALAEDSR